MGSYCGYPQIMSVEKLSVSMPADVAQLIRERASAAGVPLSTWVAAAAREKAVAEQQAADALSAAGALLAEIVADQGPVTDQERAWAEEVLLNAGVIGRAAG